MSRGAAAGLSLSEIFSRSQDAADAFMDLLIAEPTAACVAIQANADVSELELIPVDQRSAETSA